MQNPFADGVEAFQQLLKGYSFANAGSKKFSERVNQNELRNNSDDRNVSEDKDGEG